jgi:hypothetical protein
MQSFSPNIIIAGVFCMRQFRIAVTGCCFALLSSVALSVILYVVPLAAVAQVIPLPPVRAEIFFVSETPKTSIVGSPLRHQARAVYARGTTASIRYSLTTAPQSMSIDSISGLLQWVPGSTASVRVAIRAALATNASIAATQTFSLTPLPQSAAQPMVRFLSEAPRTATTSMEYIYTPYAFYGVDVRIALPSRPLQPFRFGLVNAPEGMTISATQGTVRWRPATTGTIRFSIRATSVTNPTASAVQDVEVRVSEPRPVFSSFPPREAFVGQEFVYNSRAYLPGQVVIAIFPPPAIMRYVLVNAPAGMTIDGTQGTVRWTPASIPTTSGIVQVSIRATPIGGSTTQVVTQDFALRVIRPVAAFTSYPLPVVSVGREFMYQANAVFGGVRRDFTFRLLNPPQNMTIGATSGIVRWTPTTTGTFDVTLSATYGANPAAGMSASTTQTFQLRVLPAPALPTVMNFTTFPSQGNLDLGKTFTYKAQAVAFPPTTATISYSWEYDNQLGAIQGASINAATGEFTWKPTQVGQFGISIIATIRGANQNPPVVSARQYVRLYVQATQCAVVRGRVSYSTNASLAVNSGTARLLVYSTTSASYNGVTTFYSAPIRNGAYSINAPSGEYVLNIVGGDFREAWYGRGIVPSTSLQTATPITVQCGDTIVQNFGVERLPQAKFYTLSGRVTRKLNNTAVQATIEFLGDAEPAISREVRRQIARTDAQGNYRASLDNRFVYTVRALPDPLSVSQATVVAGAQLLPQYYDGTQNLAEARKITLTGDLANVNFALADRPTFQNSIGGKLQTSDNKPVAGRILAYMTSTTASTPQYASLEVRTGTADSTGAFVVKNLTPGEYVVQAFPDNDRENPAVYYKAGTTTTATTRWREATRLTVTGASNDRITIVLPSRRTLLAAVAPEKQVEVSDDASSTDNKTTAPSIATTTGIHNSNDFSHLASNFTVTPNPASDVAILQLPSFIRVARLQVLNARGEEVFAVVLSPQSIAQGSYNLDVRGLASGAYFLRLVGETYIDTSVSVSISMSMSASMPLRVSVQLIVVR